MQAPSGDPSGSPAEMGQPDPEEKGPLRRCVVTRESFPKESMICLSSVQVGNSFLTWPNGCLGGECG